MPVSEHVQTEEFKVVQQEKEMLLEKMMKQGEELRSYKTLNEKLLKEKEDIQSKVDVPVVKIVTDQASEELAKALSQLNLKENEVSDLKKSLLVREEQVDILQDEIKGREVLINEIRYSKSQMQEELDSLKKRTVDVKHVIGAKHIIWDQIIKEIFSKWDNFVVLRDEEDLAFKVQRHIEEASNELGDKPIMVDRVIAYLNSRTWKDLHTLGVRDRTTTILEASKVHTKRNLIQKAQASCNTVTKNGRIFRAKFKYIFELGIPSFWGGNNALLQKDVYNALIVKSRNDDSKFQCIQGSVKGESIVDLLYGDFQLLFEVRKLFQNMPLSTYGQFT